MATKIKKNRKGCLWPILILIAAAAALGFYARSALAPMPKGEPKLIRFDRPSTLEEAMGRLVQEKVVRNGLATKLYGQIRGLAKPIRRGTYRLNPGMTADQVFAALATPMRQMFRFPETNWAARSANLLEKKNICTAEEYKELIAQPQLFQDGVDFPLPKTGTLEGYLYPDTYDMPPLLGAKGVIERQLRAFGEKVIGEKPVPKDLHRALIVGSMVELEVARDVERPIVAGIIENRIKAGMPLQIDAAILYGLGEWRELTYDDYRNADTPYNTYRYKGLPPGPICSPTAKSIQAALNPAKHEFLYYVALPEGRHLFAKTYAEHLSNVAKRRAALAALKK